MKKRVMLLLSVIALSSFFVVSDAQAQYDYNGRGILGAVGTIVTAPVVAIGGIFRGVGRLFGFGRHHHRYTYAPACSGCYTCTYC